METFSWTKQKMSATHKNAILVQYFAFVAYGLIHEIKKEKKIKRWGQQHCATVNYFFAILLFSRKRKKASQKICGGIVILRTYFTKVHKARQYIAYESLR